jgi:methylenetetrahydrofolate dehydrogenase (NADP+)/methenyltetrahydrofolate cyclohydrolase
MSFELLDGSKLADTVRAEVRGEVAAFLARFGRPPGLHVVLVGEDPASQVYTRGKEKASGEVGMAGRLHTLPASTSQADLLALVAALNGDESVDGILVQLPLPAHLDALAVLDAIRPDKDVDGTHPVNAGLLASGRPGVIPCTPLGCMRLIAQSGVALRGAHAVVVGRSNLVGKPVAQLLLAEHATVTIAHSRTHDLPGVCRTADVLVAAVGKPEMVRGAWVKQGAVVIDVGINRVPRPGDEGAAGKTRLVGDVCFDEAKERARAITPVPKGVGPMTIACLLSNTVRAAVRRQERAGS